MDYSKMTKVDKSLSLEERFGFLKYCAELYETNGSSPLNDFEWDTEQAELYNLDPNNDYFDNVGGISKDITFGKIVKHEIVMGSLNKSLNVDEFFDWLKLNHKDGTKFVLQHKIDGLSLSLLYRNGFLVEAKTRGDGQEGVLVNENVKYIKDVPQKIEYKDEVEIRGECFKGKKDFYQKWHKQGYANPRNFCSGSLMQKDAKITGERELSFIAYEVVRKTFNTEADKYEFLNKQGFNNNKNTSKWLKEGLTLEQISKAAKEYMDLIDRANLEYDIDGIVCKVDDCNLSKSMGTTNSGRKPKAHRAIKFPAEVAETEIEGVDFAVTRTGIISAVALLKPVQIMGTMVSRVTLYNCSAIRDSEKIKIGSRVKISKQGDIIPCIKEVVKIGNKDIDLPKVCPSCQKDIKWDSTKVNLVCENTDCTSQLASKIEHYLKGIGVKNIGMGLLSRLTDKNILIWDNNPIISSLCEIYYKLNNDQGTKNPSQKYDYLREQLGEKTYCNIIENVNSVKEITLAQLIECLGIGGIGSMAKHIVAIAPTVKDIDKLTVNDLLNISGFAEIKASSFINGWKKNRQEIEKLLKFVVIKTETKSSDKLTGKKFCFTGSFSISRNDLEKMVEENGGTASSSVGKGYILCWDGIIAGSKYEKAKKNGNIIISEEEFMKML